MQIPCVDGEFYVYEHIRINTSEVFYVGKGKGRRAFISSKYHRNLHWQRIVNKDGGFNVRFVAMHLDEELAFLLEKERISQLKTIGFKLCNMTDGGDGISGLVFSENHRKKIGKAHSGKVLSEETKLKISKSVKLFGFVHTPEMLKKISDFHKGNKNRLGSKQSDEERAKRSLLMMGNKSRTGQKRSEEEKLKSSIALSGRVQSKQKCPHCGKIGGNSMKRWHFDNCKERDS
ncbi:MAG: NUMOD3 domain-containing DNA-binding protein [Bdellovibrionales bacterium]|jgi:hypothetical protein